MLRLLPPLLLAAFTIFCLVDVLTSDEDRIRNLPKIAWFLLIVFLPLVGGVVWLVAGRPPAQRRGPARPTGPAAAFPEYDRPGRAAGPTPESDAEFLRKVRERAEEQRRKAAEEKKRREDEERGD